MPNRCRFQRPFPHTLRPNAARHIAYALDVLLLVQITRWPGLVDISFDGEWTFLAGAAASAATHLLVTSWQLLTRVERARES
jgi:hypothetical protein